MIIGAAPVQQEAPRPRHPLDYNNHYVHFTYPNTLTLSSENSVFWVKSIFMHPWDPILKALTQTYGFCLSTLLAHNSLVIFRGNAGVCICACANGRGGSTREMPA